VIQALFMQSVRAAVFAAACLLALPADCLAQADSSAEHAPLSVLPPAWAYPVNPPNMQNARDDDVAVRVPHSDVAFLPSKLQDLFNAPDWHPKDHPTMPDVVARGRKPDVYACGYCHLPDGAGRPENASLAGLPVGYIVQQLTDFKSGARRTAVPVRVPPQLMIALARSATNEEIKAAAEYFSTLQPHRRIKVVETDAVPSTYVAGWFLAADTAAPKEPIGRRIIEVPEDLEQFEHRDARARFVAYVPVGSVKAGEALVKIGGPNRTRACASCHGEHLKGAGMVPSIAGRSPSYIVRQLFDIQSGLHVGTDVVPMEEVVKQLGVEDMIYIAAYLATLR
jgi:cytochrome c553